MRALVPILAALALVACAPPEAAKTEPPPAATPAPAAAPAASAEFTAASGNIGCTFTPAGGTAIYQTPDGRAELFCDRVEPSYVRIGMSEQGPAHIIATDERGCCSGEPIAAGARWSQGPFSCEITEAGVACTSSDIHGFTLSRTQAETR